METAEPVAYEGEPVGVVSLPMRDGNTSSNGTTWTSRTVVSLPMRDGNTLAGAIVRDLVKLLAYL